MSLFTKFILGNLELVNRIIMSPLTRSRAIEGNIPNPIAATYYAQRSSAGLIISEATQVSQQGVGYIRTPGIYSQQQIDGWKRVTEAVHEKGGKIFLQLWHVGRISHPDFHNGALPVAPSAIAADGFAYTSKGQKKLGVPRALEINEIPGIIEQYRVGAKNAKVAGFDGVEIHGANGYLLDQFTRDCSNHRDDNYGGSIENRCRLPLEVARAVVDVYGAERVGYKISPTNTFNSMSDSHPGDTFSYLVNELNKLHICYLHVSESKVGPMATPIEIECIAPLLRKQFKKAFIINGGLDYVSGSKAVEQGDADLVAYGTLFISNPDLPERFANNYPLTQPDPKTFYMGEERGYTDYPRFTS